MLHPFLNKFKTALENDKAKYVKSFIIAWDYQIKRKKRKLKYSTDLPEDFYSFTGTKEIVNWMNWFKGKYPSFFKAELINPLVEQSKQNDAEILKKLDIAYDFNEYQNVGYNNAHDFFIPQSYPIPEEFVINTVLDFGAGYGRQANLWWPAIKGKGNFIAVDAIPLSYCLQHYYYEAIKPDFKEYVEQPSTFKIDEHGSDLYHIPTWRLDLIADNSVDLILCVQVLPELDKKLIQHILTQFQRILKPGGMFYIRDLNFMYKALGSINIDEAIKNAGFTLEYKAFIEHNVHLHGVPKIWRKNIQSISNQHKTNFKQRKRYLLEQIDAFTKGLFSKNN